MVYKYHPEIVNENSDFFDKRNFVGYILPNGEIYEAESHNMGGIASGFFLFVDFLVNNYQKKEKLLDIESDDPIEQIITKYLRRASHEEIIALDSFIKKNQLDFSNILVGLFKCHLITRLNKKILTSSNDFRSFHNYILNHFTIEKVDKILYSDGEFKLVDDRSIQNDFYLDEMKKIIAEAREDELELFSK